MKPPSADDRITSNTPITLIHKKIIIQMIFIRDSVELTKHMIINTVYMCRGDAGMFSTSRRAFFIGSCCGYNSSACRKWKIDSWK